MNWQRTAGSTQQAARCQLWGPTKEKREERSQEEASGETGGSFTAMISPLGVPDHSDHRSTPPPSIFMTPSSQKAFIPVGLGNLISGRDIHLTLQIRKLELRVVPDYPRSLDLFEGL